LGIVEKDVLAGAPFPILAEVRNSGLQCVREECRYVSVTPVDECPRSPWTA